MTMKELCSKFLSVLHYVLYIIDEKPKIQNFLSCFPIMFKERIEYDNPKKLEKVMRKENFCYDQNKNKRKMYQLGRVKEKIILIQEKNRINSTKTQGITIGGIKDNYTIFKP